jgi:hypothetical protein
MHLSSDQGKQTSGLLPSHATVKRAGSARLPGEVSRTHHDISEASRVGSEGNTFHCISVHVEGRCPYTLHLPQEHPTVAAARQQGLPVWAPRHRFHEIGVTIQEARLRPSVIRVSCVPDRDSPLRALASRVSYSGFHIGVWQHQLCKRSRPRGSGGFSFTVIYVCASAVRRKASHA